MEKEKNEEKLHTLKSEAIQFTFPCGDLMIAVLNSEVLQGKNKDKLFMGKLVTHEDYEELEALTDEEYSEATKRLKEIMYAFSDEE